MKKLAIEQTESLIHFETGFSLYKKGNYLEACVAYERAVELRPDDIVSYYNWGLSLSKLNWYEDAIEKYKKTIKLKPDFVNAYYNWGVALFKLERFQESIKLFRKSVELKPDMAYAYNNWGVALYNLKQYEKAIEKYQVALQIKPDYYEPFNNIDIALSQFKKQKEEYQKLAKTQFENGTNLYGNGDYLGACKAFEQAAVYNEDHFQTYHNWGLTLLRINEFVAAIDKFQKALIIKPDFADALFNCGLAFSALRRYDDAIARYSETLVIKSDHIDAIFNWGDTLIELSKYTEAVEKFKAVITISPDYPSINYKLGIALFKLKNYDEALLNFDRVIENNPNHIDAPILVDSLFYSGLCLNERGRFEKSAERFKKIISVEPTNLKAKYNLAEALLCLHRYFEAMEIYNQMQESGYMPHIVHYKSAQIFEKQGLYDSAKGQWIKARHYYDSMREQAKASRDSEHFYQLGTILHNVFGEFKNAEEVYNQGLSIDPENTNILSAMVSLYIEKVNDDV
jgi:superkiller protein 3